MERLVGRHETNRGGLRQRCPHRRDGAGGVRQQREQGGRHPQGACGERHPRRGVPRRRRDGRDQRPRHGHRDGDGRDLGRRPVETREHHRERDGAGHQRCAPLSHEGLGPGDGPEEQRQQAHQHQLPAVAVDPELAHRRVRARLDQRSQAEDRPARGRQRARDPRQHLGTEPAAKRAQAGEGEHGDGSRRVDGRDGVRRPVDAGQHEGQTGGCHELRNHQPAGPHGQGNSRRQESEADDAEQPLERELAEPAGVVGAHDVEHDEPEGDGGERLGGDLEASAAEHGPRDARDGGQEHEDGGPAAHPEPRPGDRQEDHRRDQEAGRAETEQDLRDRRSLEALSRGDRSRRGHRGEGRVERRGRRGRRRHCCGGGGSHGRGAQPDEEVVSLTQRAEQLGGQEALERQCTGRAPER